VVTVLSVVMSLRLDIAVFNVHTPRQLLALLHTAIISALTIAGLIFLGISGVDYFAPNVTDSFNLNQWRIEGLCLAAILAINMFVQNAYIYGAFFKKQAFIKVVQAISVAAAQLGAIFLGWGVHGMILLQIIATFIVMVLNIFDICKKFNLNFKTAQYSSYMDVLREHWRFPVFSMPADFIGSFAVQLPVFMIGSRFGSASAGQYALTNKALAVPMKLLAGSVLSVFKEDASRQYRETGQCRQIYIKTLRALAVFGIVPFAGLYFFSDLLFGLIFGEQWRQAGRYASILAPMFYMQFISSPLSYTLYIANRQFSDLVWQIILLGMTVSVYYIGREVYQAVMMYSVGYSLLYAVYLMISYMAAKGN